MTLLTAPAQPLLLAAWSASTTLDDWYALPKDIRKRTAKAASKLPYKDSPRSRWEVFRAASVPKKGK